MFIKSLVQFIMDINRFKYLVKLLDIRVNVMKLHSQILVAIGLGAKRNWHMFLALIGGIVFGLVIRMMYGEHNTLVNIILQFVASGFINLIQMVIIPLVVSAIIVGIASLGDSRQLGKIGVKMFFYYLIITVMAVSIGAGLAVALKPGNNVKNIINQNQATSVRKQVQVLQDERNQISQLGLTDDGSNQAKFMKTLVKIVPNVKLIPRNPVESLAKGELLPIIVFVLIFGCALASIGEINRPIVSFFESLFATTMKVTDWLMILSMPGVFALTSLAVINSGFSAFKSLSLYVITILLGLLIQLFITYPLLLKTVSKVKFTSLYKAVIESMMVAFGTASSSATLPVTIACCERRAGISGKICSFVLPLGATMSMDGTAMFQTIATIFIAQAYGIPLDIITIVQICILAIIASSTAAGIPSAGLITMVLILNGLGLSPAQVMQAYALIFAIDRFLDMFRTVINVTSDTVVASIIAESEGELDYDLLGNQEVWKEVV